MFRQELRQAEAAGKGLEAMKEEEDAELNRLIEENERINREKVVYTSLHTRPIAFQVFAKLESNRVNNRSLQIRTKEE